MTLEEGTKLVQRRVGVHEDGKWGLNTLAAVMNALGVEREPVSRVAGLQASPACLKLIQQFEGCKLTAYPDPGSGGDPWTIGWGTTGPDVKKGVVWTQEKADRRFAEHVGEFAGKVRQLLGSAPTTQAQFDAMVSFAYNLGEGSLANSTLLKKHKAGDYKGAAAEFARWNKASGKVLPGLTRRRAAEAAMYRGTA